MTRCKISVLKLKLDLEQDGRVESHFVNTGNYIIFSTIFCLPFRRFVGGTEAEKETRERLNKAEQDKIRESVNGKNYKET